MKYFVIKTHYKATDSNPNFAGTEYDVFYGKGYSRCNFRNEGLTPWLVKSNGYKRRCDASKGLKSHRDCNESEMKIGAWDVHSEIIEVEV